ncbi:AAA family ATPase [Actinotalea sp. K2]|uniref:AAA family ATPase n=1 Tax=Actinotalea sp. K2 TaxID=2939438 RepID=UPI002017C1F4|nr:AAA family ATPase [Actinotalea sp. K2]MCL3861735.1 AAA family ATPase [Actinotalea sp. K2]
MTSTGGDGLGGRSAPRTPGDEAPRDSRPDALKVASITLDGFRGVPGQLKVNFAGRNGQPQSAIVFGENGSGKSSIVDAVEWACQGKVGRAAVTGGSGPLLLNVKAGSCSVEAVLADDIHLHRRLLPAEDGAFRVEGTSTPESLRGAPMSLKRSDILRFLDSPAIRRGTLFFDHALDGGAAAVPQHLNAAQEALEEDRHQIKVRLREAGARLAGRLEVEPPPRDSEAIMLMIKNEVYLGLGNHDWGRITVPRDVRQHLDEIDAIRREMKAANHRAKVLGLSPGAAEALRRMQLFLGDVSEWMTTAFRSVTGASHVDAITVQFGRLSEVSLEVEVALSNGSVATPRQVFSEGYQDLVALLYFLAVSRAAGQRGQSPVLILDDVLQSVDASIRVALMDLVVREFRGWQLLVTVHDRMWRTQLRDIFQRAGHPVTEIDIRRWEFADGPHIAAASSGSGDIDQPLWVALGAGDPATVCGVAGRLLEQICDRMSWTIPISVQRKRGDAYTLGDLWPGTVKEMKGTTAASAFAEVDRWLHLRNALGAHYNEWAESATWSEAEAFGLGVLDIAARMHCGRCKAWVERRGIRSYQCRCGETSVVPT